MLHRKLIYLIIKSQEYIWNSVPTMGFYKKNNILQRYTVTGKAIPLQALTGPDGSRGLRLPDFKTIGT
jgi:hypothetical protein